MTYLSELDIAYMRWQRLENDDTLHTASDAFHRNLREARNAYFELARKESESADG